MNKYIYEIYNIYIKNKKNYLYKCNIKVKNIYLISYIGCFYKD